MIFSLTNWVIYRLHCIWKTLLISWLCMILINLWPWWRHQMEIFSALLAICAGNSPVPGEFPAQRPVTRSFDVCFDLHLDKRLSKQSWGWWFETLSRPLWRHSNDEVAIDMNYSIWIQWLIAIDAHIFVWKLYFIAMILPANFQGTPGTVSICGPDYAHAHRMKQKCHHDDDIFVIDWTGNSKITWRRNCFFHYNTSCGEVHLET